LISSNLPGNLLKIAISSVAYLRHLFPDETFVSSTLKGQEVIPHH
jgi:hypothetical protein